MYSKDGRLIMTDEEIKEKMIEFRTEAEEGNRSKFRRMSKCERFRIGKQWDADVLRRYESKRKHALTINMCHPTINQLAGTEVQNPRDIRVYNTKGSSKTRAKILTALAKNTMDNSKAQRHKSMMFEDGTTTGCGWVGIDEDYNLDPVNGDIVIKKYDPFMVLPDPNRKNYDLNAPKGGAKYVIIDEWVDKDKIDAEYPGKKQELTDANYNIVSNKGRFANIVSFIFNRFDAGSVSDDYRDHAGEDGENTGNGQATYNYRVSTCWWKDYKPVVVIYKADDPLDTRIFYKKADIKKARQLAEQDSERFRLIDKDREGKPLTLGIMNKTVMVGDVLLDTIEDPNNGVHLFRIVPYSPYWVNGYEFGVIENLIGPQEHTNFSWSMELNLIKNLANTGWKVAKGTLKKIGWLKSHGVEDGVVINESDYGDRVEKLKANEYNQGYAMMTERGKQYFTEVSNIRTESPQTDKDRVASAIRLKQASSFTGNANIFSNYDYTIELLGNVLVETIRRGDYYSTEEILAIVDREDVIDPEMLNQARAEVMEDYGQSIKDIQIGMEDQPLMQQILGKVDEIAQFYAISRLIEEIKNLNKGRFGIKVSLAPMAETYRAVKAIETMELNKMLIESGLPPLSRRQLIEAADPPNKEAILAESPA